jgi:HSP90 family molecular chaperone
VGFYSAFLVADKVQILVCNFFSRLVSWNEEAQLSTVK